MSERLVEILNEKLSPEEELDRAWGIFQKLSREDRFVLMLYLSKQSMSLTETKFFIRFAHDNKEISL